MVNKRFLKKEKKKEYINESFTTELTCIEIVCLGAREIESPMLNCIAVT